MNKSYAARVAIITALALSPLTSTDAKCQTKYATSYQEAKQTVLQLIVSNKDLQNIGAIRTAIIQCCGPLPREWVASIADAWKGNGNESALSQIIDAVAMSEYGDTNLLKLVISRAHDKSTNKQMRVLLCNCVLGSCGLSQSWQSEAESDEQVARSISNTEHMLDAQSEYGGIGGYVISQILAICKARRETSQKYEWKDAVVAYSMCLRVIPPTAEVDIVDDIMWRAEDDDLARMGALQIGVWLLVNINDGKAASKPASQGASWEVVRDTWKRSRDEVRQIGWRAFQAKRLEALVGKIDGLSLLDVTRLFDSGSRNIQFYAYRYALDAMNRSWNCSTCINVDDWLLHPISRGQDPVLALRLIRDAWRDTIGKAQNFGQSSRPQSTGK